MKKYALKRIVTSLFTLLAILLVLFILMQLMPGSPFNDEKLNADQRAALYTKYGLQDCEECRQYFTENFIIKYHQGLKEAKALGIENSRYWRAWCKEQKETVKCFLHARLQHGR